MGSMEMTPEPAVHNWSVKILSRINYIFVGVCLPSRVVDQNFTEWDWAEIGHGQYLISSSGKVYSSSDKSANYSKQSFSFDTGDVIKVEFDLRKGTITFKKGLMGYVMNV